MVEDKENMTNLGNVEDEEAEGFEIVKFGEGEDAMMPQDENGQVDSRPHSVAADDSLNRKEKVYSPDDLVILAATENLKSSDENRQSHALKLVGCRLELKWSSGKWYRGTICEYNPSIRRFRVVYDDGDCRWYYLPEMVFRFVKEEDEWVKC